MASSGKPTAVHFALIFFVMVSVILGVVSYMFYSENDKNVADHNARKKELETLESLTKTYQRQIQDMKTVLGYPNYEVGSLDDPPDAGTVLVTIKNDMQRYNATGAGAADVIGNLQDLAEQRGRQTRAEQDQAATIARQESDYEAARVRHTDSIKSFQQSAEQAKTELEDAKIAHSEALAAKDTEIASVRSELNKSRQEYAREKEDHKRDVDERDEEIRKLVDAVTRMNEQLADARRQSFEVEDGVVQVVDHNTQMVWINLGDADGLSTRSTFSVYTKDHQGVGRDPEDIKGSIEVVRILGPHLAQARILRNDTDRPITKGDPIYSPLWSPGRAETFALAGLVDIDGDGTSDRAALNDLVTAVGARFTTEINEDGERVGPEITVQTKFLVIGQMPDIANITDQALRAKASQIVQHANDMEKEARLAGVRRIRLNDFLDYIGYKPSRRLWRPGESYPLPNVEPVDTEAVTGRYSSRVGDPQGNGYRGQ